MRRQQPKNPSRHEKWPCYKRNRQIVERRVDDTVFLVNPETETIFYLNPLGTVIWQLLAQPISAAEATTIVQQAFPAISPEQIADDVSGLFKKLRKKNLVLLCKRKGSHLKY
jgi:hypothetical protein